MVMAKNSNLSACLSTVLCQLPRSYWLQSSCTRHVAAWKANGCTSNNSQLTLAGTSGCHEDFIRRPVLARQLALVGKLRLPVHHQIRHKIHHDLDGLLLSSLSNVRCGSPGLWELFYSRGDRGIRHSSSRWPRTGSQ